MSLNPAAFEDASTSQIGNRGDAMDTTGIVPTINPHVPPRPTAERVRVVAGQPSILPCIRTTSFTDKEEFEYVWTVANFRQYISTADVVANCLPTPIVSPSFTTYRSSSEVQFSLKMYPGGTVDPNYITLYVVTSASRHPITHKAPDIHAEMFCSVVRTTPPKLPTTSSGSSVASTPTGSDSDRAGVWASAPSPRLSDVRKRVEVKTVKGSLETLYFKDFDRFASRGILLNESNGYLTNDSLTIRCEVILSKEQRVSPTLSLAATLFNRECFSDVTLRVKSHEFRAHKCVLAARSPVFNAMFESPWIEGNTGCVVMDDVEPGVIEDLLNYIYRGKGEDLAAHAEPLFIAADKYDISSLRDDCEEALTVTLSPSTVAPLMSIAHKFHAERLRMHTLHYVANNRAAILANSEFCKYVHDWPEVADLLGLVVKDSNKRPLESDDVNTDCGHVDKKARIE